MTETNNTIEAKELNALIEKAKKAYAAINQQENKSGKNIYDLGETLIDLKKKAKLNGVTFDSLCDDHFDFSRQYGYRMIKFHKIQKKLHGAGLLANDAYLSNSMLLTLMRSKEPVEIWQKALEQTATPTEKLICQLIGIDKDKTVDIRDMIAKVSEKNILKVLLEVKKQKYYPTEEEQQRLIGMLSDSWELLLDEPEDNKAQEDAA